MNILNVIITDLRQKRLLPVALVLVVGLVAVPLVLAKHGAKVPVAAAPVGGSTPAGSDPTAVPALNVVSSQGQSNLKGKARDPFTQQKLPGSAAGGAAATALSRLGVPQASGIPVTSGGGATSPVGGTGTTAGSTPPATITPPAGTPTPPPAPAGLGADQAYAVAISITNSAGGLDRIDPLQRLGVLPASGQPLLIELGVLKGGRQVLFALQPGTVVSGPGSCTPGPIDCEILSLSPNQVEGLSRVSANGVVPVAEFAITAIRTEQFSSADAALKARERVSAVGRRLLDYASLPALSLFQYTPSVGAVVDLRDLTIGAN